MTTVDFITALFFYVDDHCTECGINGKHPQAKLYVSEIMTLDVEPTLDRRRKALYFIG